MDRTPPEIWIKILKHACTDSGATGRQLSLVSKFIREASAPVKLQSISVHGRHQIIALHQLLSQTPPHLRHIRYLFLSNTPLPPTSRGTAHFMPPPTTPKREPSMDSEESEDNEDIVDIIDSKDIEQSCAACSGVLAVVAECVEILYLDVGVYHLSHFPTTSFPQLVELANNNKFPMVPDYSRAVTEPNTTCGRCPKLRRWHLMGPVWMWTRDQGQGGLKKGFANLRITAPEITHLRLSGLKHYSGFVSDMKAGLPETIQHVYVKPAAHPGGMCGNAGVSYRNFMRELKGLNFTDSRLVLLPEYKADETVGTCIMSEWEERINGGDGCWSLGERVLTEINHSIVTEQHIVLQQL